MYDTHTWREIWSQPETWATVAPIVDQQAAALAAVRRPQVIFTGCGSTYYLALAAAALYQATGGRNARGLPASEIWLGGAASVPNPAETLLVAVSRSGATTETLRAVAAFRAAGGAAVLTLSCYPDQPLAALGDLNLVFPAAQEQSIAQTRAFSALYVVAAHVIAHWTGDAALRAGLDQLPDAGTALLATSAPLARALGQDDQITQCFFLGSGARYGLACELSLKCKEMSLTVSEPFHFLEFRHGPVSMVGLNTLVVGLLSDTQREHEVAVLTEMRALGAQTVALGADPADVALGALPELARGALYLPFGQLLAYERAVHHGHNPDRPHQLSAVVRL